MSVLFGYPCPGELLNKSSGLPATASALASSVAVTRRTGLERLSKFSMAQVFMVCPGDSIFDKVSVDFSHHNEVLEMSKKALVEMGAKLGSRWMSKASQA